MSTNFRLELVEPSAKKVEGQQFFFSLSPTFLSRTESKKYLFSKRLYKLQAKINGHAVEKENTEIFPSSIYNFLPM